MFKNIIKTIYFRIKYLNKKVKFDFTNKIAKNTIFHGYNKLGKNVVFTGEMGLGSYIGQDSKIHAYIGRFCSIAGSVNVVNGNHPISKFVSTSPSFFSTGMQNDMTFVGQNIFDENNYADDQGKYAVIIGNDVWIGFGVTIIAGVKISDGAVIAAGAVVTKDVAPYTIVGGIPAKEIKKRFDSETIEFLLKFKWWDKPIDWLRDNAESFSDIKVFIDKYRDKIQ